MPEWGLYVLLAPAWMAAAVWCLLHEAYLREVELRTLRIPFLLSCLAPLAYGAVMLEARLLTLQRGGFLAV
jgi:hypothetical protein